MINEEGPSHSKEFTWQLTLGEFITTGTGPNKKVARNIAAEKMLATIPEEWGKGNQKKKGEKRIATVVNGNKVENIPQKKSDADLSKKSDEDRKKIVISADNPIACLFEYASKMKIPVPEFTCTANTIEYIMEVKIQDLTYRASAKQKKSAKQACAQLAWEQIRTTML